MNEKIISADEAILRQGGFHTETAAESQLKNKGPAEENITQSSATDQCSLRVHGSSINDESSTDGLGVLQHVQDPESGEQSEERQQSIVNIGWPRVRNGASRFFNRLFGRSKEKAEIQTIPDDEEVPEEEQGAEIKILEPTNRCLFEGLYPRGPSMDYDLLMAPENVELLAEHLDCTKPTAANLAEWIVQESGQRPLVARPTFHLDCLFAIVQNDTVNTLHHMEFALQEIALHTLDDTLIQKRLVHWRLLLERFGNELQQLEDSLRRFASFINAFGSGHRTNDAVQDECDSQVEKLLEESVSQINLLRQRITRSQRSLMANMSIVESKRGIAEAESVTKLTELAFFFVPLTFSASIFSMQVKELNASRISIAAFFTLSIIITTVSYALRLLIRSEFFVHHKRKILYDIRKDAELAPGSSIPTRIFLAGMWRRVGLLTVIVIILVALLTIPVAVLWTKDMNHGFKILLTILLLAFILATSYFIGKAILHIDARGLHLRRDIFKAGTKVQKRD